MYLGSKFVCGGEGVAGQSSSIIEDRKQMRVQEREEATASYVHHAHPPWSTPSIPAPPPTSYNLPMMLCNESIRGLFKCPQDPITSPKPVNW